MKRITHPTLAAALCLGVAAAVAQSATHTVRVLTPEAASKATQAALASCRQQGYQVAAAVVDRFGVAQAMVRDRFAGPHTSDTAINKAWTAVSFRSNTGDLARATQPGQPSSGIRQIPRFVGVGGGVLIEAGGSIIGAVGISGAPTGDADDACAKAGIAAIRDELEL
ncbi:heme-binding protein [uncultured Piscinibacter sp.]|uniref:GlcG/HbpS family heme-binding protein n=1 Tax=uncultured Piscinibacter sp. TaxID=1131835 RepID=UPI002631A3FB|nr:heme-binding protein [uncultured Piscinibacter sp.]